MSLNNLSEKQIKLNIGCGKKNFGEDWIHIDGSDYPHIQYKNIFKLEFENSTVDLIYLSHVFEYFDRDEAKVVLKEYLRVLKPNGVLRLAVPDFEACARIYTLDNVPLSKFVGMLYGKWKMTEDQMIYHKTVYDYDSLKEL